MTGLSPGALVRNLYGLSPGADDSLRVRATLSGLSESHGALTARPPARAVLKQERGTATITVGAITAAVDAAGHIRFLRTDGGTELLAEKPIHFWWPGPRNFTATGNGYQQLEQSFAAYDDERLFGLGQHTHGRLDQKGMVLDLVQRNAEVSIPFILSNRGYGFLWNNPAVGRVELGRTATRWVSDSARQIDYWVTAGSPAQITARYADVTGHAPMLPSWAAGFLAVEASLPDPGRASWRWRESTTVVACLFPSSLRTSSTGPSSATGASSPASGLTPRPWWTNCRLWACA